ncbi:MAG: hypothetical protein WB588_04700 [Dehalococcoidia bacterium]
MAKKGSFGARVYLMDGRKILIYQTHKSGAAQNERYIVYPRTQQGAFVDISNDKAIASAVRAAVNGKMI